MKFLTLTVLMSLLSLTLQASGMRALVKETGVLKFLGNEASVSYLSKTLGITRAEIAALSSEQLATRLDRTLTVSQKEQLIQQSRDFGKKSLTATEGKVYSEAEFMALMDAPSYRPSAIATDIMKALAPRSGEVNAKLVTEAVTAMDKLGQRLGTSILGAGAPNCVKNYSALAVNNFAKIGVAVKDKALRLTQVTQTLAQKTMRVLEVNEAQAMKRVCGLAGINSKCQVLGPAVAMNCR